MKPTANRSTAGIDAPVEERAVMFIDVVSSTEIVRRCGDRAWLRQLERHTKGLHAVVRHHGGRFGNFLGDGFLFQFERPGDAVVAALRMRTAVDVQGMFDVRIGIDHGPILPFHDQWHVGLTLHVASRLTDRCRAGEIVLSDRCYQAARADAPIPPARSLLIPIRGLDEPQLVHVIEQEVLW